MSKKETNNDNSDSMVRENGILDGRTPLLVFGKCFVTGVWCWDDILVIYDLLIGDSVGYIILRYYSFRLDRTHLVDEFLKSENIQ